MKGKGKVGYAILLAGGKSSRMRSDKALLQLSHNILLNHQRGLLQHVAHTVMVSRNDGLAGHIADIHQNMGPLAGIHACLKYIATHFSDTLDSDVIILPVDMPIITPELIMQLAKYGREFGLPCYFRDTNLPIYLPHISKVLQKLEVMLARDQRIVNTFLDQISAKSLVCHEPDKIANANTPMQWKLLKRAVESSLN